ncbi:MAG TPA: inositol monophosphatase family protein [Gemmatimonadales bacterium]|nr:inositol monophosphatase family protein [Gemmatimonadales bacterium]
MDLLHLATTAAERAAAYLRSVERPRDPAQWGVKSARDFVTDVDRTAEGIIREVVLAAEPGAAVVGEELGSDLQRDGLVWIVDPLDGTTNFLHGYPWYAVSLAAAVDGVFEAGVIVNVPRNETFRASRGAGAWLGSRRLSVSTIDDPGFALIGTGYPFRDLTRIDEYQAQFARVSGAASGLRRAGSAALDLVSVASGEFEAFWEQQLSAWDIAAGAVIVREAGGVVTDFTGRDIGIEHSSIVAGSPAMHGWLLDVIRGDGSR